MEMFVTVSYEPQTEKKESTHGTLQWYHLKREILETGKTETYIISSGHLWDTAYSTLSRKTYMEGKIENKTYAN